MESFKAMAGQPFKNWQEYLEKSIVSLHELDGFFSRDLKERVPVLDHYPMRINPYYLSLITDPDDPLGKQAIPHIRELDDVCGLKDPLDELGQSPVANLIHRYPDRVVFLVSDTCAMFCRHCMRKRNIGIRPPFSSRETLEKGLGYIRNTPAIRDVILSGGDPLMLDTPKLDWLLKEIRKAPHVDIIRIHSRIPCTLPMRITENLVRTLSTYHPLYLNTHFNHPDEITEQAAQACARLADSGIPLGCQTVLLKGVNDTPEIMVSLMRKLIKIRVKPYYLHHPDPVAGTAHFRPSLETGFHIMKALRGHISGIAVPQYMIDLPGGKGKTALLPFDLKGNSPQKIQVENYLGDICEYPF
ncbi:MAG: KamA family radical SAM protein [Proteobacteria bacterium]|nr:KamA family radical SAM protein [Pseudomonadota bacterium]